jgi:hypothetical protein
VPEAETPPSATRPPIGPLIDLALMQVASQLEQADADDGKALAVLTLDAALAGTLIGVRLASGTITGLWFLPLIGLLVASGLLVLSLRPRDFSAGPPPGWLFQRTQRMTPAEADEELLAGLQAALTENGELLENEGRWYYLGLIVTALTVIVGGPLLYVLAVVVP